jgi:hypothetical protein
LVLFSTFSVCHRWDTLTGNLELVEQIDGHSDIVYGSFDPKYFKRSEFIVLFRNS